jgi:predicted RND superfamily exporter protein
MVCQGMDSVKLKNTSSFIEVIRKTRQTIEDSPLKGHVFPSGVVFTFWEIFGYLWDRTWILMASMVGVVFLVSLIFTRSPITATIVAIGSGFIVIEIWGIMSLCGLKFSFFVATPLIMAGGLSIEYTAHISAIYARHVDAGDLRDRLNIAMQLAFPAVWMGALTTVMGILPMSWGSIPFFVKYFFLIFIIVTLVGLLNAFVFLPATLACLLPGALPKFTMTLSQNSKVADEGVAGATGVVPA